MKQDQIRKQADELIDKVMESTHDYYKTNIELCLMLANNENEVIKKAVEITNRTISEYK